MDLLLELQLFSGFTLLSKGMYSTLACTDALFPCNNFHATTCFSIVLFFFHGTKKPPPLYVSLFHGKQ